MATNEIKRKRAKAAEKFRPNPIELLLVAEAPPAAADRYFYFEHVAEHDSLFRYVARGILGVQPTRDNKPDLLRRLQARGVFLSDLSLDPVGEESLDEYVPDLVRRAAALKPRKVIVIKTRVFDVVFEPLLRAGLPVVNERIPFPGSGQQKRFEESFSRALGIDP